MLTNCHLCIVAHFLCWLRLEHCSLLRVVQRLYTSINGSNNCWITKQWFLLFVPWIYVLIFHVYCMFMRSLFLNSFFWMYLIHDKWMNSFPDARYWWTFEWHPYGWMSSIHITWHVMWGYKCKTCCIIWGYECKTCLGVTWENMDGHAQTHLVQTTRSSGKKVILVSWLH